MKLSLLAIETSTHACSVALLTQNKYLTRFEITPREQTQRIFPMINSLLEEAEITLKNLDAIAVGRGPGSFTGIRIAVSVAQGLGFGLKIPLFPISTLEALALQTTHRLSEPFVVVPALDARMNEVYISAFSVNNAELTPLSEEKLINANQLYSSLDIYPQMKVVLGSGWDLYQHQFSKEIHFIPDCHPQAEHIAILANKQYQSGMKGIDPLSLSPVYLRDKVAEKRTNSEVG